MNLKEQLLQEIEALPSDRLAEALAFVQSLQTKPSPTSARSFLAHLKEIGTWSGDDLQECLEAVKNSRGEAQFNYNPNPASTHPSDGRSRFPAHSCSSAV